MTDTTKKKPGPDPMFDDGIQKRVRLSSSRLAMAMEISGEGISATIDLALEEYIESQTSYAAEAHAEYAAEAMSNDR